MADELLDIKELDRNKKDYSRVLLIGGTIAAVILFALAALDGHRGDRHRPPLDRLLGHRTDGDLRTVWFLHHL